MPRDRRALRIAKSVVGDIDKLARTQTRPSFDRTRLATATKHYTRCSRGDLLPRRTSKRRARRGDIWTLYLFSLIPTQT